MHDSFMSKVTLPPPPDIENQPDEQSGLLRSQKVIKDLIIGVVIVLLIGLVGVLIATGAILESYLASKQATYEDLKDQINQQTMKIDALYNQCYLTRPK